MKKSSPSKRAARRHTTKLSKQNVLGEASLVEILFMILLAKLYRVYPRYFTHRHPTPANWIYKSTTIQSIVGDRKNIHQRLLYQFLPQPKVSVTPRGTKQKARDRFASTYLHIYSCKPARLKNFFMRGLSLLNDGV